MLAHLKVRVWDSRLITWDCAQQAFPTAHSASDSPGRARSRTSVYSATHGDADAAGRLRI